MGYIYKISNDINKQLYIGFTTQSSIQIRFKQHINAALNNNSTELHQAMKNLGVEHFKITLLEECPNNNIEQREKYWIQYYDSCNNGYNMNKGGGGYSSRVDHPEFKQLFDLGYSTTEIAELCHRARVTVEEYFKKTNAVSTEERKKRHYETMSKNNSRHVYQIDPKTGIIIQEFDSAEKAAQTISGKGSSNNIREACNKKNKTSKGFAWRYVDQYNPNEDIPAQCYTPPKGKPIRMMDKYLNTIQIFDNAYRAAEYLNKITNSQTSSPSAIHSTCKGKYKTYKGFYWEYV